MKLSTISAALTLLIFSSCGIMRTYDVSQSVIAHKSQFQCKSGSSEADKICFFPAQAVRDYLCGLPVPDDATCGQVKKKNGDLFLIVVEKDSHLAQEYGWQGGKWILLQTVDLAANPNSSASNKLNDTIEEIRKERDFYRDSSPGCADGTGQLYKITNAYRKAVEHLTPDEIEAVDRALGPPRNNTKTAPDRVTGSQPASNLPMNTTH
ncbi:MAG: hypothetical protein RL095_3085 [Verrucomicrobiota bacterium]|jgi:hypothetical protein